MKIEGKHAEMSREPIQFKLKYMKLKTKAGEWQYICVIPMESLWRQTVQWVHDDSAEGKGQWIVTWNQDDTDEVESES